MILGKGVNGNVIIKDGMALKTIKLDILDIQNRYKCNNYRNIDIPPPRNCDLPGPFFKDTERFIAGINPWREIVILKLLNNVEGIVELKKYEIDENNLYIRKLLVIKI